MAALDERTEGWVAGLRLAAVVLQAADPATRAERFATLLSNFRGDDRHVFDYLTEEVFDRLAAEQQTFLVQTALLQRLCGALSDGDRRPGQPILTGGTGPRISFCCHLTTSASGIAITRSLPTFCAIGCNGWRLS